MPGFAIIWFELLTFGRGPKFESSRVQVEPVSLYHKLKETRVAFYETAVCAVLAFVCWFL